MTATTAAPAFQILSLPFPPSVNHYWRSIGRGRVIISEAGRRYREAVRQVVAPQLQLADGGGMKKPPRLGVLLSAMPPDDRRRDLDNMLKAPLDAMKHAGAYEDDSQIDLLTIRRRHKLPGGRLHAYLYHTPATVCPCCGQETDTVNDF
jgi:crossover junction endodeoxyribonuclease RusA